MCAFCFLQIRQHPRHMAIPSGRLINMFVTRGVRPMHRTLQTLITHVIAIAAVAGVLVACGRAQEPAPQPPQPLQSSIPTPALPGNVTVVPAATAAIVPPAAAATVAIAPTPTARIVPTATTARTVTTASAATAVVATTVTRPALIVAVANGTPDTRATSQSVILTLTALAEPPTRGPTKTPTRAVVIGAGGGRVRVTHVPTPTSDPSGVTLLSLSKTVYRGGAATLSIRTKPGAQCGLRAQYTQADGSVNGMAVPNPVRLAGSDGVVAWIWPIDTTVPTGKVTLDANCANAGMALYHIEVAK